jgi:hypothetical protein
MTRLLIITSAGMLAGAWRLQQEVEAARWMDGAEHICKQFAQSKPHRVQDRVCLIEIGGVWHKPPGVVSR